MRRPEGTLTLKQPQVRYTIERNKSVTNAMDLETSTISNESPVVSSIVMTSASVTTSTNNIDPISTEMITLTTGVTGTVVETTSSKKELAYTTDIAPVYLSTVRATINHDWPWWVLLPFTEVSWLVTIFLLMEKLAIVLK